MSARRLHSEAAVARMLEEAGAPPGSYTIERGGQHWRVRLNGHALTLSVSPSDGRAEANQRADIRRALRQGNPQHVR